MKAPSPHALRHSHASWMLAGGASLHDVQRRLGHESITTTVDRYGHLAPDAESRVAAILEGWAPADVSVRAASDAQL